MIPQQLHPVADSSWQTMAGAWWVRDLTALVGLTIAALGGALVMHYLPQAIQYQLHQVLILLAMAGVATAAILVAFAGRLDRDVVAVRIGSALLVYGTVVLPLAAVGIGRTLGPVGALLEVLCIAAVTALLGLGVLRRGEPTTAWPAAAISIAVCLCATASTATMPALRPSPGQLSVVFHLVQTGWAVVVVLLVGTGIRSPSVLSRRVGLGLGLIVLTHTAQFSEGLAAGETSLAVSGLRFVAVVVMLMGVVPHVKGALARQSRGVVDAAVRLQAAEAAESAAADRAHEMRNVVTGLSSAAYLLTEDIGDSAIIPDRTVLATALRTELDRLSRMLDTGPRIGQYPEMGSFELAPVVATVVAVRRAGGTRIDVDVPAGLRAQGAPEAFAQVVTNLLVNCARHAPGAPVHLRADQDDDRVLLRVVDEGLGIALGAETLVLGRGRRSPVSGGSGLGLGISAALMREHGGALRVLARQPGTGFGVELELPAPGRGHQEMITPEYVTSQRTAS